MRLPIGKCSSVKSHINATLKQSMNHSTCYKMYVKPNLLFFVLDHAEISLLARHGDGVMDDDYMFVSLHGQAVSSRLRRDRRYSYKSC